MLRLVLRRALIILLVLAPGLLYVGAHLQPLELAAAIYGAILIWRARPRWLDPPPPPPPPPLTTASLAAALGGDPWPDFDRVTQPEDRLAIRETLHPVQGRTRGFHTALFLRERNGFTERTSAIRDERDLILVIFAAGPTLHLHDDIPDPDLFGWQVEIFPGAGVVLRAPPELAARLWGAPTETAPLIRELFERLTLRLAQAGAEPIALYAVPIRAFARSKIWP